MMDAGPFTEIGTRGKGVELGKLVESSQCKSPEDDSLLQAELSEGQ